MGRTFVIPSGVCSLADALERAVALDLVDPVARRKAHLAARCERDREAEDRALQPRLRDLLAYLGTSRLAVRASPRDRANDHLGSHVRRQTEELAVALVGANVRLNRCRGWVVREGRVVGPCDLPDTRGE